MTIKERVGCNHHIMEKYVFQNPQKKALEELKVKYKSSSNSFEEYISALDEKWCNKNHIFTLYVPPPIFASDREFPLGSKEDWLERMKMFVDDMNLILQLEYHRFWSEVMFNNHFLDGVSSFLQNAFPFYLRHQIPNNKEVLKALKQAQESVFLVLIRLTTTKESEACWIKSTTLGNTLYNNFVISFPQLIEISLIYAKDNFKEVTELMTRVIESQPKYVNDMEKSIPFISQVFRKVENELNSAAEDGGEASAIIECTEVYNHFEMEKLINLMLDISYSLATFVEICPLSGTVFHEHQLEARIATFYGNTVPVLNRHLDSYCETEDGHEEFKNLRFKLNLSRHQLISAVHGCLTAYLSSILEERDHLAELDLKNKVDKYLNTISECLSCDHVFVYDYNSLFPIHRELKVLSEICPDIDSVKFGYIEESVMSTYEVPKIQTNYVKHTSGPTEAATSSSASGFSNHIQQHTEEYARKQVSGVELESLITEVKDILPHLGDGYVAKCLEHYNFVSADVINAILESTLPEPLVSLDPEIPIIPSEDIEEKDGLPERINIFDNDEFDIMTQNKIDTSRIHKGKRSGKHKNISDLLDDKTHVNQLRDVYTQLSLVETMENVNDYEDEYDDTYDDLEGPVNDGDTEVEERRAFVIPRVLQQRKNPANVLPEYSSNGDDEENEEESKGTKADLFIENPADVRERAEQRRQEMRGRTNFRSRAAFQRHDVVGKPKGQGQEKDVVLSREFKNTHKSSRGNHNRRSMADKKRRQGMVPT